MSLVKILQHRLLQMGISLLVTVVCSAQASAQISPWADQQLPVQAGLWLWLDAQAIDGANQSLGLPSPADGERLQVWRDGSGNGRDFLQPLQEDQPTLTRVVDALTVRFDGNSDSMRCLTDAANATAATVFVVAAPHSNPGGFRALFAANATGKNDYQSGWNLIWGVVPVASFTRLNVEGLGFGGERNLLGNVVPFGMLHIFQIDIDPASEQCAIVLDGEVPGDGPSHRGVFVGRTDARRPVCGDWQRPTESPRTDPGRHCGGLGFRSCVDRATVATCARIFGDKHKSLADDLPRQLQLAATGSKLTKVPDPPPDSNVAGRIFRSRIAIVADQCQQCSIPRGWPDDDAWLQR